MLTRLKLNTINLKSEQLLHQFCAKSAQLQDMMTTNGVTTSVQERIL